MIILSNSFPDITTVFPHILTPECCVPLREYYWFLLLFMFHAFLCFSHLRKHLLLSPTIAFTFEICLYGLVEYVSSQGFQMHTVRLVRQLWPRAIGGARVQS